MDSKSILKKLDRIDDLPTLPVIAMEVNTMLQDYNTSIQDLCRVIENDQALVPRILKLVNSSFYGFKSKIANIDRAIILLGFNTIRNAIISVAVLDAFSMKKINVEGFDIKEFWAHSVAVAVISRYLSAITRSCAPEDAFTAGLLHDIGKIVIAQYFPDIFKKILESIKINSISFYEAEKKEIPINHARLGTYLAKKWKLPDSLSDTIRYHHAVKKNVTDSNLLMVVHTADIITNECLDNTEPELDSSLIFPEATDAMSPYLNTLPEWLPEVKEEINSACEFFLDNEA